MEETGGSSELGDVRISWRQVGAGEPLVVINGYAAGKADWDPVFISELASSSQLLCPDGRGIGDSGRGSVELTIELLAEDVAALMADREIERAPVLGWSMGGYVAQALAAAYPERVEALVLLATDLGGSGAVLADSADWAILTDHSGTPHERAERLLGLLFPEQVAAALGEDMRGLVAAAQAELDDEVLDAQQEAIDRWHAEPAEERIERITCPLLCAAGREDRVIPAQNSVLIAERFPEAWLARFPGAGHAFMAQEPKRLAALIRAFLDR